MGICVEEGHTPPPYDDPIPLNAAELREIPEEIMKIANGEANFANATSSFIEEVSRNKYQSNWWNLLVDIIPANSIGWLELEY